MGPIRPPKREQAWRNSENSRLSIIHGPHSRGIETIDKNQGSPAKESPICSESFLLLASEILILVAITVLWVLTTRNNGFVDVPDTPSTIEGSQNIHGALLWAYSLLWTFLPAFVVSMCGAFFSTTLQALEDCQPTIELRKHTNSSRKTCSYDASNAGCILPWCRKATSPEAPKKSTAKLTVLLDYGGEWLPLVDTFHAFRNKHFLIGLCMMVKWSFAAIGPLASAIISIGNVPSSINIKVTSARSSTTGRMSHLPDQPSNLLRPSCLTAEALILGPLMRPLSCHFLPRPILLEI